MTRVMGIDEKKGDSEIWIDLGWERERVTRDNREGAGKQ